MNRDYELAFILNPEVSEEEIRSLLDRIEQIVANYGSQIVKVNQWGRRHLAYPIKRSRDGYYIFIDMILTPEAVAEIERMLRVSETVFRHMMKRRDPKIALKEREARAAAAEAAANKVESPAAPSEVVPQAEETPTEGEPETAEVATTTTTEEPAILSPEEIESAPPAVENSETIEA